MSAIQIYSGKNILTDNFIFPKIAMRTCTKCVSENLLRIYEKFVLIYNYM